MILGMKDLVEDRFSWYLRVCRRVLDFARNRLSVAIFQVRHRGLVVFGLLGCCPSRWLVPLVGLLRNWGLQVGL